MNFQQAIVSCIRNYVGFEGRAARSEYWYWVLFVVLLGAVTSVLDLALFPGNELSPLNLISTIVLLLPNIAVSARRLHDIDRTGWWLLLVFTIIGGLVLLYWAFVKGTNGVNRYGPDPLA
jgi:uncharacterized membrane protein YhaH (DUF805 family)